VKKGKKKKAKEAVYDVPWNLAPAAEGEDERCDRFIPSRGLM